MCSWHTLVLFGPSYAARVEENSGHFVGDILKSMDVREIVSLRDFVAIFFSLVWNDHMSSLFWQPLGDWTNGEKVSYAYIICQARMQRIGTDVIIY